MVKINSVGTKLAITCLSNGLVRLELTLACGTTHVIPSTEAMRHDVEHVIYSLGFSQEEENAIDNGARGIPGDVDAWCNLFCFPLKKTEDGDTKLISSQIGIECTLILEVFDGVAVVTSNNVDVNLLLQLCDARKEVAIKKTILIYNMLPSTASAKSRYYACNNVCKALSNAGVYEEELRDIWDKLYDELTELAFG